MSDRRARGGGRPRGPLFRAFAPLDFPGDPERTSKARHLHTILWSSTTACVAYGIALPLVAPHLAGRIPYIVLLFALLLVSYLVLLAGKVFTATVLSLASIWAVFALTGFLSGGVRSMPFAGNLLLLLNAAILLQWPGIATFGFLTVAEGLAFTLLEQEGLMPPLSATPWSGFILMVVFLAVGAVTLRYTLHGNRDALQQARHEIRERMRAEERLRASEERYRLISEVSTDYTFSSRLDEDGVLRLNWVAGGFERNTGWTFEEYVARGGWLAALHPDDVARDAHDIAELRQDRDVVTEVRTLRRDGTVRWVRVYAHPVWDETRQLLVGIYGAVQDVTDRREAEAERERLLREMEAKNAELERFTYTVSHDLKAPLITIQGFLGLVERGIEAGDLARAKADLGRIEAATARMQRLLGELLELSRVGRMMNEPEIVPFAAIVRDALETTRGRLEAGRVTVRVSDGLPSVRGDRVRLLEVVQNLLDNAAKFTGDRPDPLVEVGAGPIRDGTAEFFVRDNGIGIDPAYHERVFGLFTKLDPSSEGTGVGLALVKRIVEVHGGRLRVASDGRGTGATFFFTLPVA